MYFRDQAPRSKHATASSLNENCVKGFPRYPHLPLHDNNNSHPHFDSFTIVAAKHYISISFDRPNPASCLFLARKVGGYYSVSLKNNAQWLTTSDLALDRASAIAVSSRPGAACPSSEPATSNASFNPLSHVQNAPWSTAAPKAARPARKIAVPASKSDGYSNKRLILNVPASKPSDVSQKFDTNIDESLDSDVENRSSTESSEIDLDEKYVGPEPTNIDEEVDDDGCEPMDTDDGCKPMHIDSDGMDIDLGIEPDEDIDVLNIRNGGNAFNSTTTAAITTNTTNTANTTITLSTLLHQPLSYPPALLYLQLLPPPLGAYIRSRMPELLGPMFTGP
ncbi:hypothetical protein BGZ93_005223 [Podila epicladia]|nr:hypothetical protein BGZ93_005223 [Podila epicladia]